MDGDAIAVTPGHFLNHDRIGAIRHNAAGKNARGFARADRRGERPAGGDLADDL